MQPEILFVKMKSHQTIKSLFPTSPMCTGLANYLLWAIKKNFTETLLFYVRIY